MTNPNPIASLWFSETPPMHPMTPMALQHKAETFRKQVVRRNLIDNIGFAVMALVFAASAIWASGLLARFGSGLTVLAILLAIWQTRRKASAFPQADLANAPSLTAFYRGQLERQRNALRTSLRWYILPFIPGVTLFILGTTQMPFPDSPLLETVQAALPRLLAAAALLAIIFWASAHTVRRLNRELDALDKVSKP